MDEMLRAYLVTKGFEPTDAGWTYLSEDFEIWFSEEGGRNYYPLLQEEDGTVNLLEFAIEWGRKNA